MKYVQFLCEKLLLKQKKSGSTSDPLLNIFMVYGINEVLQNLRIAFEKFLMF